MQIILSGVTIVIELYAVHIYNDEPLRQLLGKDPEQHTDLLVKELLRTYEAAFHQPLGVSTDSLAVEIWGHLYVDQFAKYIDRMIQLELIKKVIAPIQKYCAVIDCGEKEHDGNRWFWDLLAPFKSTIASWLPGSTKGE